MEKGSKSVDLEDAMNRGRVEVGEIAVRVG